jgi:hypothetical protein
MKERKTVTKAFAEQYRRAGKGMKGRLLTQFVEATSYDRCYAAWLLRHHGMRVQLAPGRFVEGDAHRRAPRPRKKRYGPEVLTALIDVWKVLDYICGKRLAAALPQVVARLVACKELRVNKTVREKLSTISPATIDRVLKPERAKHTIKGRARTKPGTLLKHQIPVRTFSDWDDARPGFVEVDLVGHDGGTESDQHCYTLNLTDVATGWSEQAAVLNRAEKWTFEALMALRQRLPFDLLGLDSDNGGEFINHHLAQYCKEEQITFTRSRPARKNDNCFIEQKNWSIVRRFAGYARYDSVQTCNILNELYRLLRDYNNFFLPSAKLKEKTRNGARVTRRYDTPQTPYHRLVESPHVAKHIKTQLQSYYNSLNPAALRRKMQTLQDKLLKLAARPQPGSQTGLPLSCQSESTDKAGANDPPPPLVLAPESALGSHPCVALSSAQATKSLHKKPRNLPPAFE